MMTGQWGVIEALDSAFEHKYLTSNAVEVKGVNSADAVHYCEYPLSTIQDLIRQYTSAKSEIPIADQRFEFLSSTETTPGVYLSDDVQLRNTIAGMVKEYALNPEQELAFTIVAAHSFGIGPKSGRQLLLGLFGEGGTGKSTVINAIRAWFLRCG
jgi:hypothetical protein